MDKRKIIGLIWARGNGSSLHRKSVYPILEKPLISYILSAARDSGVIDRLYVFTEDREIIHISLKMGWQVITRPDRMVEHTHPEFNMQEIQNHQNRHILTDLGANQREIDEGKISHRVRGIFHFNCNHCLIRPETIRAMHDKLTGAAEATRICPAVRVDPHLFIMNGETGAPFPVWHEHGLDRREYPALYRLFPDTNLLFPDRLKQFGREKKIIHEIGKDEALDVHDEDDIALAEFYLERRRTMEETTLERKARACN